MITFEVTVKIDGTVLLLSYHLEPPSCLREPTYNKKGKECLELPLMM